MTEAEALSELAVQINKDADYLIEQQQQQYTVDAFAQTVLERLDELGVVSDVNVCSMRGGHARGAFEIHGYAILDDENQVDLYSGIHKSTVGGQHVRVTRAEVQTALNKLLRFLKRVRAGDHTDREPSAEQTDMMHSLYVRLKGGASVRLLLFSDGEALQSDLVPDEERPDGVKLEMWDIVRLYRASQATQATEVIEIDVLELLKSPIPCLPMPQQPDEYQAYLAIIPGIALAQLYERFGGRLMELNVRSFLQARGKVNGGIRTTLLKEPFRFMAYNNGISATVNKVEVARNPDGSLGITHMRGLQIVNGGQTTASIHNVMKKDGSSLTQVFVPMKITVLEEEQYEHFVPLISRYANTQNVIQMADLSANNNFHIELERLANQHWCPGEKGRWFYERARGAYQVALARAGTPALQKRFKLEVPPARKLSKTDVARCLVVWEMKPHRVCEGAQKNFVKFMEERIQKGLFAKPDEKFFKTMVAKHILFRDTQEMVKKAGVEAYRAQVTAYLVAYLAWITGEKKHVVDFSAIWKRQGLSNELKGMLWGWAAPMCDALIRSAGKRNVTEWCKKEQCWQQIRELKFALPLEEDLPPDIRQRKDGDDVVEEALYGDLPELEQRVLSVDHEGWEKVARWGMETGELTGRQQQQAHTLARRAANNWKPRLNQQLILEGARMLRVMGE